MAARARHATFARLFTPSSRLWEEEGIIRLFAHLLSRALPITITSFALKQHILSAPLHHRLAALVAAEKTGAASRTFASVGYLVWHNAASANVVSRDARVNALLTLCRGIMSRSSYHSRASLRRWRAQHNARA